MVVAYFCVLLCRPAVGSSVKETEVWNKYTEWGPVFLWLTQMSYISWASLQTKKNTLKKQMLGK